MAICTSTWVKIAKGKKNLINEHKIKLGYFQHYNLVHLNQIMNGGSSILKYEGGVRKVRSKTVNSRQSTSGVGSGILNHESRLKKVKES